MFEVATVPKRSKIAVYRQFIEPLEKYLWLPFNNPDVYSLAGLLMSLFFLFLHNTLLLLVLLVLVLFTDWLDGAAARRYKRATRKGYIVDNLVDRISECCLFLPLLGTVLGNIFFILYVINIFLTYFAMHSGKHYVLPLRFAYLLILVAQLRIP
jgi:phosphatidylglycerophosphate synthase